MINEKYKWPISIVSIILSLIFIVSLINFNSNKQNVEENHLEVVLDKESVTEINIDIKNEEWEWLLENALNEEYRSANITINGETFNNVGIRPKGNSTLTTVANDETTDRFSFKVKFDEYVDGQTYHGMSSIVLNNNIQDTTYMKEYLSYDLFDFMGIATPEMSYADIKLNGETWGLYLAVEVVDERYLQNNFGTIDGNLYKPETMGMGNKNGNAGGPGGNPPQPPEGFNPEDIQNGEGGQPPQMNGEGDQSEAPDNANGDNKRGPGQGGGMGGPGFGKNTEGADFKYIDDEVGSYSIVRDSAVFKRTTDSDFKRVINMFKNLNEGTNLEEVLDVKEVLKYFAINTYLSNFDSYSGAMYHNYYLYEKDGKCQILPWDFNLSFGGFSQGAPGQNRNNDNNSSGANNMINFPIDKVVTGNLEDAPLIGKLLEVDEYKELYHSYLKQIAEEYFESGYYAGLVNKIDNLINDYVKNDSTAFYGYDKYTKAIPNLLLWGEDRTKSVLAQLNGEQPSTEYGNIQSDVDMDSLTEMGRGGGPGGERPGKGNDQAQKSGVLQQNNNQGGAAPQENITQNENTKSEADSENNNQESNIKSEEVNNDKNLEKEKNRRPNMEEMNKANVEKNKKNMIMLGGYSLLGFAGLIFVIKFKRRGRYR